MLEREWLINIALVYAPLLIVRRCVTHFDSMVLLEPVC